MATRDLEVVVYKEGDGYVAQCLNVNVASEGDTEKDALENIREALELYFEDSEPEVASVENARVTKLLLQDA